VAQDRDRRSRLHDLEVSQLALILRANLTHAKANYLQHEQGLISDRAFESVHKGWVGLFAFPATRVAWAQARGAFDPAFAACLDDQRARASITRAGSAADFNSAVAAEIAASEQSR
jgi:hypothetical protein